MNAYPMEVDARGLNCPLPILRLKKAVQGLDTGKVARLLATDPDSVKDVEAFCRQTGNTLVAAQQDGADHLFLVRKSQLALSRRAGNSPDGIGVSMV